MEVIIAWLVPSSLLLHAKAELVGRAKHTTVAF